MRPTLSERDLLEIEPCTTIHAGDVLLFFSEGKLVVHRVVEVAKEGIRTRGDNNSEYDIFPLSQKDVAGRVVAAWRGQRRRVIRGGFAGRIFVTYIRMRRRFYILCSKLLFPCYVYAARKSAMLPLKSFLNPRLVHFATGELKLMLGPYVLGRFDPDLGWKIRPPFRLFIDVRELPDCVDPDGC